MWVKHNIYIVLIEQIYYEEFGRWVKSGWIELKCWNSTQWPVDFFLLFCVFHLFHICIFCQYKNCQYSSLKHKIWYDNVYVWSIKMPVVTCEQHVRRSLLAIYYFFYGRQTRSFRLFHVKHVTAVNRNARLFYIGNWNETCSASKWHVVISLCMTLTSNIIFMNLCGLRLWNEKLHFLCCLFVSSVGSTSLEKCNFLWKFEW